MCVCVCVCVCVWSTLYNILKIKVYFPLNQRYNIIIFSEPIFNQNEYD